MNREQFEAAYRAAFPSHGFNTSNLFVAHDGLYGHAHVQVAWKMWQAGAAAENERLAELADNRPENMFTLNAYEIRNGDRGIT